MTPEEIQKKLAKFGLWVLDYIQDNEWGFPEANDFSDEAVEIGLMTHELYDPRKHGTCGAEDGDMIYYVSDALNPLFREMRK